MVLVQHHISYGRDALAVDTEARQLQLCFDQLECLALALAGLPVAHVKCVLKARTCVGSACCAADAACRLPRAGRTGAAAPAARRKARHAHERGRGNAHERDERENHARLRIESFVHGRAFCG